MPSSFTSFFRTLFTRQHNSMGLQVLQHGQQVTVDADTASAIATAARKKAGSSKPADTKDPLHTVRDQKIGKSGKKNLKRRFEGLKEPDSGSSSHEEAANRETPPTDPGLFKSGGRLTRGLVKRQVIPSPVFGGKNRRFPPVISPIPKGLRNPGILCYRNAVLQALLHSPAFYRYLGQMHKDCNLQPRECVVCALQDLAHTYWNMDSSTTLQRRLNDFHLACSRNMPKNIPALAEDFQHQSQSDSYDFIRYLISEQLKSKSVSSDDASFDDVFALGYETTWTCDECSTDTVTQFRPDAVQDLGLQIQIQSPKEGLDFRSYLDEMFFENLNIHCDSEECMRRWGVHCDSEECMRRWGVRRKACIEGPHRTRFKEITHAPELLVIQFQRFARDARGRENKITSAVKKVPRYLSMNKDNINATGDDLFYRLDGIVCHIGNLKRGHYIAVGLRGHDGVTLSTANDSRIIPLNDGTVEELLKQSGGRADPYVLIYTKL